MLQVSDLLLLAKLILFALNLIKLLLGLETVQPLVVFELVELSLILVELLLAPRVPIVHSAWTVAPAEGCLAADRAAIVGVGPVAAGL
jgi:hypothetical protein